MKKALPVLIILSVLGLLAACMTPASTSQSTQASPTSTPGIVSESYTNALPVSSQLALGIINLKGTANAVTAEQAKQLLLLWKGARVLAASSTSSQIEINDLYAQIQESLNTAQLQAIADMKLTQTDVARVAQVQGAAGSGTASSGTTSSSGSSGSGRTGQDFGGFGGGPGGDIAGIGGGGTGIIASSSSSSGSSSGGRVQSTPASQATIQARIAQRASSGNTLLISAVISYLEQVTGS